MHFSTHEASSVATCQLQSIVHGENRAVFGLVIRMSDTSDHLSNLWRALRAARLQHLAVPLVRLGIRSVDDVVRDPGRVLEAGVHETDVQSLLQASLPSEQPVSRGRHDLPTLAAPARRASFTLALQAAQPNNRKRSLEALDKDIVAKSSAPSHESRLRTFRALAAAWQVAPFPLSVESIRCVGASLKAGGYRSAQLYYQSAINHQMRFLREQVHPLMRAMIRDMVRSIKRGLGPAHLKHGFDPFVLADLIDVHDDTAFDYTKVPHFVDVMILSSWFMLREIEIAGATQSHFTLQGNQIQITIPVHKTSSDGAYTTRVLRCGCRVVAHRLCPWHSAERHLIRLSGRQIADRRSLPFVPDGDGRVLSKHRFIEMIRETLKEAGVSVEYSDDAGNVLQRFGGHCLRVSGAQMLASAGTPVSLIQLLGRWSSTAVERYTQQAPMSVVPDIPGQLLGGRGVMDLDTRHHLGGSTQQAVDPRPNAGRGSSETASSLSGVAPPQLQKLQRQVRALESELQSLRDLVPKPLQTLILRHRSNIVHLAAVDEVANEPSVWVTRCGWQYGTRRFFRVAAIGDSLRKCQKCFQDGERKTSHVSDDEGSGSGESSGSDSSSSENEDLAPADGPGPSFIT